MDNFEAGLRQFYSTLIQGIPVVTELGLIPMKAKAWLDMTDRKAAGEKIDSKNIRKHRAGRDTASRSSLLAPATWSAPQAQRMTRPKQHGPDR